MSEQWWVLQSPNGEMGLTQDLDKAYEWLVGRFRDDYPTSTAQLGWGTKPGSWYLFSAFSHQCLREYSAMKAEVLR